MLFMNTLRKILALLLLSTQLPAQDVLEDWMQSYGTGGAFEVGMTYHTLVTDANLREQATTQARVISKLPIGTTVTVEAISTDSLTLRGVKMPWLKVQTYTKSTGTVQGYLWGGFLALASIQTPNDPYLITDGVLFMTGIAAYDPKQQQITLQVRLAKEGVELAKSEFTTHGDLFYYPNFSLRFEPLKNVKAILNVDYSFPACGYPSGNNLLFWLEDNSLMKVLETTSISDGGVFYDSEECLFPTDKGGIAEHLIVVKDMAEMEESEQGGLNLTKQEYKITLYKWTGQKLLKSKELK